MWVGWIQIMYCAALFCDDLFGNNCSLLLFYFCCCCFTVLFSPNFSDIATWFDALSFNLLLFLVLKWTNLLSTFSLFLLFWCSFANVYTQTRVEPVGKTYREVCLQTKWWSFEGSATEFLVETSRAMDWTGLASLSRWKKVCIELLFKLNRVICRF